MNKQFFSHNVFILNQFPFKNNNFDNSKSNFHKSQFISKIFKVGKYTVINRFFKNIQKQKTTVRLIRILLIERSIV